jgi:single-stranded-DNA-specific exonuclease
MKKRWKVSPANKELQGVLARELDILPLTAQLLINRGLVDSDMASSFLNVDGTTSIALIHLFFKEFGVQTLTYIPERLSEGYGLNTEAIKKLKEAGVEVIITADCGISNHDEVAFARSLGIDCIITDHHEVTGEPPSAHSVLNPRQSVIPDRAGASSLSRIWPEWVLPLTLLWRLGPG